MAASDNMHMRRKYYIAYCIQKTCKSGILTVKVGGIFVEWNPTFPKPAMPPVIVKNDCNAIRANSNFAIFT